MATVLYARVSTTDQTLEHQRIQAEAAGFNLDCVITDHGVSGGGGIALDAHKSSTSTLLVRLSSRRRTWIPST